MMYAADGSLSVHIVRDPPARWAHQSPEDASVEERAPAFERYYGYSGRYSVDVGRGAVTHGVDRSLEPDEVGVTCERRFRLENDRLLLTATPFAFEGEQRFNRSAWKRAKVV